MAPITRSTARASTSIRRSATLAASLVLAAATLVAGAPADNTIEIVGDSGVRYVPFFSLLAPSPFVFCWPNPRLLEPFGWAHPRGALPLHLQGERVTEITPCLVSLEGSASRPFATRAHSELPPTKNAPGETRSNLKRTDPAPSFHSAQQLFLGQSNKVYIVDKTEKNPVSVGGHPAWATEYDIETNEFRVMDIETNSFCAGGNVLGNGTWVNVGGNQPVGPGGLNAVALSQPYDNGDGGKATRCVPDHRACLFRVAARSRVWYGTGS